MSSTPAPTEVAAGVATPSEARAARSTRLWPLTRPSLHALKRSLTAQISLSIAICSILLVAGSSLLINRLAIRELREGNELIMFGNLALLREDLAAAGFDLSREPQRLVKRMDLQLGQMHMALLDERRRVIAASERFEVPLAVLPKNAIPIDQFPPSIEHADVRALGKALGPLTTIWKAPDGSSFRLLLASIPLPADAAAAQGTGAVLVAFAYDTTQTRQLIAHELEIFVVTLLIGATVASLIGVWMARRIVAGPMRLAAAANRISARPMSERLSVERTPTELVESTHAFNRMLDRLEAAFKRLSEFSSDIAHDLRTPINNLLGEAQVALSRPRSAEEYKDSLEKCLRAAKRMKSLVESLLVLARADAGKLVLNPETFDLAAAAEECVALVAPRAQERNVTVEMKIDAGAEADGVLQLHADRTRIMQLITNLLANGIQYNRDGGKVTLTITATVTEMILAVADTGVGISPEDQVRVFERFFRADKARSRDLGGSGLGLAICRSITEAHHGSITFTSRPGEGTTFTVRLRLVNAGQVAAAPVEPVTGTT